jgi:hypothetical protein
MGIGHKPAGTANAAFTEGYVSLAMADDNPAGTDADLLTLQEYFQDAGARDTAGMALALNVAEGLANRRPLNFVIGQTSDKYNIITAHKSLYFKDDLTINSINRMVLNKCFTDDTESAEILIFF